jgi:CheY-like chemotaxis protein
VAVWEQFRPQMESLVKAQLDNVRKDVLSSLGLVASPPPSNRVGFNATGPMEKRALVCESDPAVAQHIVSALQSLGYTVQVCSLLSEALKRLEGGFFEVITAELAFSDDPEGGQKLLNKVNSRKLDERRKMFLAMISRTAKTLGPEAAFFHGANVFINKSDLHNLENLIQDGIRHYAGIYGNYFEVLAESTERL